LIVWFEAMNGTEGTTEGTNEPDDSVEPYYSTPTLMRAARGVYARSMRKQLQAIGADDLPRNGVLILAGIHTSGEPRANMPTGLGVSKQAVSQVVETLVSRDYVERSTDPEDRRRVSLSLTARGQEAVEAAMRGVDAVDNRLSERVSSEQIEAMRAALSVLAEIKEADLATGEGVLRPTRQLRQFSPVFPVSDLSAALSHYSALGFGTFSYEGAGEYGFANRDGIGLHLAVDNDHPHVPASAYLYVRDADALYEEWSRPGIEGRTLPVNPTPYKLLEGAHFDPDGNLIRFGSPMDE
jgi:DNA-binding MarR family transcriptional regulator